MNEMELMSTKIEKQCKDNTSCVKSQHDAAGTWDHATNHQLSKGSLARTIRTKPDQFTSDRHMPSQVPGFRRRFLAGAEVRKKTNETNDRIFNRFDATRDKCMC